MVRFKKVIFSSLIFLVGLLLVLAGLNLIQLSQQLLLYIGVGAVIISILVYLLI